MADDITNTMLLEHMQAMKNDLQKQITDVQTNVQGLRENVQGLRENVQGLREEMHRGFAEAKEHRQALQEDLEATMQLQLKHQEKLARISV